MVYNDGRFDWAIWDPISGRTTLTNTVSRMTIHTAATTSPDIYGPDKGPDGSYAHFYNPSSARIRQHQEIHHKAYATGDANGYDVGVEHQDAGPSHGAPLTSKQIDDDARLFAHLVLHYGTPNRIATVDNTHGLAWHRLGISGNFGTYDPHNRRTWSRAQTGAHWSSVQGKVCPWDERIDQIDDIYAAAQAYISGQSDDTDDEGDDMPKEKNVSFTADHDLDADGSWRGLKVNGDPDAKSAYTLISGPALATGTLSVHVNAPAGTHVDIKSVHIDTKSGTDSKEAHSGFVAETVTAGGTTQIIYPFTEDIGEPAQGWSRKLRFQIQAHGGQKLTVTDARARTLYWDK